MIELKFLRQEPNAIRNTILNKTALAFYPYQPQSKYRNYTATYVSTEDSK